MSLDPRLLGLLACPLCKAALAYDEKASRLICSKCARVYPVTGDIPDLVV